MPDSTIREALTFARDFMYGEMLHREKLAIDCRYLRTLMRKLDEAKSLLDKHPDTERLNKLAGLVLNFRTPLAHGSRGIGWYSPPVDEEGEPTGAQTIRQAIDAIDAARLPACPECRANGSCAVHGGGQ